MPVTIFYFAWFRMEAGWSRAEVMIRSGVNNVERLLRWLSTRKGGIYEVFACPRAIYFSVNQTNVKTSHSLHASDEIALFLRLQAIDHFMIRIQHEDLDSGLEIAS